MVDSDARRRKLTFRASHRGMRELDLYFEKFLAAHLDGMGEAELDQLEAILDIPDQEVYNWLVGRSAPSPDLRSPTLDLLLAFRYAARDGADATRADWAV